MLTDKQVKIIVDPMPDKQQVLITTETVSNEEKETRYFSFDPESAAALADCILEAAKAAGYQEPPREAPKKVFTDLQRLALIKRTEHVFRSLSGRKIDNICTHVVDTILAEVL